MISLNARSETEAKKEVAELSRKHPGMYVTVFTCFGLFAGIAKRLDVFAPSDSVYKWYGLNGQIKPFTEAQRDEDWRRTPQMS